MQVFFISYFNCEIQSWFVYGSCRKIIKNSIVKYAVNHCIDWYKSVTCVFNTSCDNYKCNNVYAIGYSSIDYIQSTTVPLGECYSSRRASRTACTLLMFTRRCCSKVVLSSSLSTRASDISTNCTEEQILPMPSEFSCQNVGFHCFVSCSLQDGKTKVSTNIYNLTYICYATSL